MEWLLAIYLFGIVACAILIGWYGDTENPDTLAGDWIARSILAVFWPFVAAFLAVTGFINLLTHSTVVFRETVQGGKDDGST